MSGKLRTYTKSNLVDFYTDVLRAIDNPDEHTWFGKHVGLCSQIYRWADTHNISVIVGDQLYQRQLRLFKDAGLNHFFPFNNGNAAAYAYEGNLNSHYTNPARLDWVKRGAANEL